MEWAGTILVGAAVVIAALFTRRNSDMRVTEAVAVIGACILLDSFLYVATPPVVSLFFQGTQLDRDWLVIDVKTDILVVMEAVCLVYFLVPRSGPFWRKAVALTFSVQMSAHVVMMKLGHVWEPLHLSDIWAAQMTNAQVATLFIFPLRPQVVGFFRELPRAFSSLRSGRLAGERAGRRVRVRPPPYLKERFPGEGQ